MRLTGTRPVTANTEQLASLLARTMSCLEHRGELRIPSHGVMVVALVPLTFSLTLVSSDTGFKMLVDNSSVLPLVLDMHQL